jgi:hypothetical protein
MVDSYERELYSASRLGTGKTITFVYSVGSSSATMIALNKCICLKAGIQHTFCCCKWGGGMGGHHIKTLLFREIHKCT